VLVGAHAERASAVLGGAAVRGGRQVPLALELPLEVSHQKLLNPV